MTAWVVLFRGVGGATQLPTNPLAAALVRAGFENVRTYINSGNAVLKSGLARSTIHAKIAAIAREEFGFEKDIFLVSRADWHRLIAQNPFPQAADTPTLLHVFVLSAEPDDAKLATLRSRAVDERIETHGRFLYFHTPSMFSRSKAAPVIDRTLGLVSTARNWRSVLKLGELVDAAA